MFKLELDNLSFKLLFGVKRADCLIGDSDELVKIMLKGLYDDAVRKGLHSLPVVATGRKDIRVYKHVFNNSWFMHITIPFGNCFSSERFAITLYDNKQKMIVGGY